jgi:RNA polymerase sigma-70 factor (ECF subfamily)
MAELCHRVILPASTKVDGFAIGRNREAMANVTNSETLRGTASVSDKEPLVPAERQKELVRRAQAGDASAYEELVRIHQRRVLAVVGNILRGSQDIEDVAQQALAKAYFSIRRFDLRSAFGTWLYKIAVNECWDYLRKKKVRRLVYESDLSEEQVRKLEAIPEHGYGGASHREDTSRQLEQRQLVERLLGELDDKDQIMLVMKEVEGFSVEEIGEILELNVNTVKVRLFRARGRLMETYRKRLQKRPAQREGLRQRRSEKIV